MDEKYLNDYLSRYVAKLRSRQKQKLAERDKTSTSLERQIREWYEQLPPSEKGMEFGMAFLVNRFGAPPSVLGPLLHQMGWVRRRRWGDGPYRRMWSFKRHESPEKEHRVSVNNNDRNLTQQVKKE